MLKKEGITDQKKLSLMFPNSVNYLDKLEMLIGRTDGVWDYDVGYDDRALYLAYISNSGRYKVELVIDSEHPECYLAVNIAMNSEDKNGDHAATKELVEKLINSGVQLTDLHFAFKLTIYFRPYNNERVMNEATGIVQAILPLL
mgnify:FL=1